MCKNMCENKNEKQKHCFQDGKNESIDSFLLFADWISVYVCGIVAYTLITAIIAKKLTVTIMSFFLLGIFLIMLSAALIRIKRDFIDRLNKFMYHYRKYKALKEAARNE